MSPKQLTIIMYIALASAPIFLIALHMEIVGFLCYLLAWVGSFSLDQKEDRKAIRIILICLLILYFSPISTDTSNQNIILMGLPLLIISFGTIWISPYILKKPIHFQVLSKKKSTLRSILYPIGAFILAGVLIPWYFSINPDVPFHWTLSSSPSVGELTRLFRGSNFLGMRDELFFISVLFSLLRRQLSFRKANIIQACFFTSFLYELAFTGIGPLFIFPFALIQGYIFEKRESIGYIIVIHLLIDTALYFSIVSSHAPGWYSWFPWF